MQSASSGECCALHLKRDFCGSGLLICRRLRQAFDDGLLTLPPSCDSSALSCSRREV